MVSHSPCQTKVDLLLFANDTRLMTSQLDTDKMCLLNDIEFNRLNSDINILHVTSGLLSYNLSVILY